MPSYESLKSSLLRQGSLFEDPDFRASAFTLRNDGNADPRIRWRRPGEIVDDPKFIVRGKHKFDLDQGQLGDCWFVAAAGALANQPALLEKCVPSDQSFDDDYAGIFRFRFWRFGSWTEVVVDDRLPTVYGKLIYASNRESEDEFWPALLEKAYAKLSGNYENIDGGVMTDALVDMTGGVGEAIRLKPRDELPDGLFDLMHATLAMKSFMGCSVKATKFRDEELPNGLYAGHAYSINNTLRVDLDGRDVRLVRLLNPWGRGEWTGAWSDGSADWYRFTAKERDSIGLVNRDNGEFWMAFDDWVDTFDQLEICHLEPEAHTEALAEGASVEEWNTASFHSEWVPGVSAGGCGNAPYEDLFWVNPQFSVTLKAADDADEDGLLTTLISLMQKSEDMQNDLHIHFYIFKVREGVPRLLDGSNYDKYSLRVAKHPGTFTNYREVTARHRLPPGNYVIIPSTYKPNLRGEFFLRIFTEKPADSGEMDNNTDISEPADSREGVKELFDRHAGGDTIMDAAELRDALNDHYKDDVKEGFSPDMGRGMIALLDKSGAGLLTRTEFTTAIKEVDAWKSVFATFDRDHSGSIDTYELSKVFQTIGEKMNQRFTVSRKLLSAIVVRYGGKRRRISLEDFILCCSRVMVMYGKFVELSPGGAGGKAELDLEQWMATTVAI